MNRYALEVLSQFSGRKIAVLGDILELGDFSEDIHQRVGDLIIKNNIDILITVGNYAKYINERALQLGLSNNNSYHFNSNIDAINVLNKIKKERDNILIKASHNLNFIEIVNELCQ